jgi:hypothetical protein
MTAPDASIKASLLAGAGRADITPRLGTRLMGYPIEGRVAQSIHDPLHVTALVLQEGDLKAAIFSIDTAILDDEVVAEIRAVAHTCAGILPDHVTVCAIQTHTGPAAQSCFGWGDKDRDYVEEIMLPGVSSALQQANAKRSPVRLGIGITQSQVGVNRREVRPDHSAALGVNPWGPYDPTMTVLRFEGANGPAAVLVHYGAHPTSIGPAWIVSRDWPGVMIDQVEKLTGALTFFVNGAVGDVGPRLSCGRTTGDGIESAFEVGYRAAADTMRALKSIKEPRDVHLAVHTEEILLPYRPLPASEEAHRRMVAAEPDKDSWGAPMCEYLHWRAVAEANQVSALTGKQFRQTITRLGPIVVVPFPGEPFAEIVLRLRHYSPFQYTLCASTTNGSNGYFATRESLHRGGYEVWVGKAFGPYLLVENIDDVLVESNLRLLDKMAASE